MIRSSERRTTTRPAGGRSHVSPPHAAKLAATPTPPRERKPRASSYSYFRSFFPSKKTPVHPSPSPVRRPAPETDRTQRRDALEQMRSRSSAASRIAASLRSLRDRFAGTRTRPNKVSPMPPPRPATVTTLPSPTRTPTRPRDPRSPRTTTPRRPPSFTLEPPTPSTPAVAVETTPTEETLMEETLMPTPTPTPPTSPQRTRATPPPRRRIHVRVGTPPREPVEHPPAPPPPPPPKEEVVEDAEEEAAFVSEDLVEEDPPKTAALTMEPADPTPKSPVRNRVPIREMKTALAAVGLDTRQCVEREDLEALYGALNSSKRPRIEITDEDEDENLPDDVPDDGPSTSFDLFDALPSEVNELVLRELSPRSLARATGVNRAWRSAASRDELWAEHLPPRPRTRGTKPAPKPKPAQTFNTRRVHTHHHERRELMREYAAKRELGGCWREGMFVLCDFWDHARPVECVKFVDHVPGLGRVCVTGGWDGRVFAYTCDESATRGTGWELVRRFEGCGGGWVASLIASPRCVVAGGTDGKVCAWTFGSSEPTRVLTQGGSVTKIVFVPNRKGEDDVLVAAASTDGDVVVWDLVCGTRLATLRGHLDAVWHVSPLSTELDGTVTLLTSSRDSTLRLWRFGDVDTDELLDVPRGIDGERVIAPATTWRDHDDAILSMTVSDPPSESCVNVGLGLGFTRLCATCGADGKIVVRDVATGVVCTTLTTSHATSHAGNDQALRAPMCATFFEWPEDPAAFTVDSSRDGTRSRRIRPDRGDPHRRRTFLWLAAGYRVGNVGEVCLWDPVGGVLAAAMSDHGQPVSDVVVTEHALITVAPTDGVIVYTRNGDVNGDTSGNSKGNACPVSAAVTVLDGAGSDGFSSCAGVCGDALAVGSKTGSVQLLDFRPNHRP